MASNSFGNIFKILTWGESHGKAIGVVIDGCPAGVILSEELINKDLALRSPGRSAFTSPRKESDTCEILSGVYQGITTGAPISIIIYNKDADSSKYEAVNHLLKPGHAQFTYLEKYGVFDDRGGGRASARETACRVAAGAVAKQILLQNEIYIISYLSQIGNLKATVEIHSRLKEDTYQSPIYCPDQTNSTAMKTLLSKTIEEGDSLAGVVSFIIEGMPAGIGDPVYEKLEANLAKAMMSLPASKGFEIGAGFDSLQMTGYQHNDRFVEDNGKIKTETNFAGGILGGISNGMPIFGKVCFKPASSIKRSMNTVDKEGKIAEFCLPEGSRHDPCVAIRAVPVVEAMAALVVVDAFLLNKSARVDF